MQLQVGDHLHGFLINRVRPVEDAAGTLYEMTHEKTGAQLAWLYRKEDNKTFCIGFKTIPSDDTGVFHIIEHSVLEGSKKYPLREPFVDLLQGSLQTFLNAMTYPDKTIYPVSSRHPQDFLNLMDVYLDAVFHPSVRQNPNIFYQEGWHYELRDPLAQPIYKGVVFNEMKGAFANVDETLINEASRMLFPDTCYRFVSGGDPEHIPDLTYEQLTATHAKFYHPSNARIFLDGDLDIDTVLDHMDREYLSAYEKETFSFDIPLQKETAGSTHTVPYAIGSEEDDKDRTQIALAATAGTYADVEKLLAWQVISSLLTGDNDAILTKAILACGLAQDVELSIAGDDIQQPVLMLVFRNTNSDAKEALFDTLRKVAENVKFDQEEIKAILNRMEFHYRMNMEPAGVTYAEQAYRSWLYDGDPLLYLNSGRHYEELRQKAGTGYFEELVKKMFNDPSRLQCVVAMPDQTLTEKMAEKETRRLAKMKASWSDAQVQAVIACNQALDQWQATPDSPQAKKCLPHLSPADLAEDPLPLEGKMTTVGNVPAMVYDASASGNIVYCNLYFEMGGIRYQELPSVAFFASLLTQVPTANNSLRQLQRLIKMNIGILSFGCDAYGMHDKPETCKPMFTVRIAVLKEQLHKIVKLLMEIMKHSVFTKEAILPLLQQSLEGQRQALINSGHGEAMLRAAAHFSAAALAREYMFGFESIRWKQNFLKNYDMEIDAFIERCTCYADVLFTASRLYLSYSDNMTKELPEELIEQLGTADYHRAQVHYPLLEKPQEMIVVPTQVGHSAWMAEMGPLCDKDFGAMLVMTHALSYTYLWDEIRVKGGAYGTRYYLTGNGNIGAFSFRDPTPLISLRKERDLQAGIKQLPEDLSPFIIGTIAHTEPLLDEFSKIAQGDVLWFTGSTYASRKARRQAILCFDCMDLQHLRDDLLNGLEDRGVSVLVGPKEISEEEKFTVYLLS